MKSVAPLVALLFSAPILAGPLPPGRSDQEVQVGDRTRSFRLVVPVRAAPPDGYPLLVALHGAGGSARSMEEMTGLHALGELEGFVTVYARGSGADPRRDLTWNAGSCCGYAQQTGADDVAYVRALLDRTAALVQIDSRRVFAVGFSNGAMLAYLLASALPDRFAAIGAVGAPPDRHNPIPSRPVPVIHFHGTADRFVPFRGGLARPPPPETRPRGPGGSLYFRPIRESLRSLARHYGLPASGREELPDRDPSDGTRATRQTWGPGPGGSEVVLLEIEGGTHSWPGGPEYLVEELGHPSRELDANRELWDFFGRHPRPLP